MCAAQDEGSKKKIKSADDNAMVIGTKPSKHKGKVDKVEPFKRL